MLEMPGAERHIHESAFPENAAWGEDGGSAAVCKCSLCGRDGPRAAAPAAFPAVSQSPHYAEHIGEFKNESVCDLFFPFFFFFLEVSSLIREAIQVVVNVILTGLLERQGSPTEPRARNVEIVP